MKELPVRKNIRLTGYDYSQNGAYFVTICVKGKHEILGEIVGDDAHIVPPFVVYSEYGNIVEKHIKNINGSHDDVNVDKYIIMPNHVHIILVLQNNDGTMWASSPTAAAARIPGVIRTLKTLVTKQIGFSVWQRSYHDRIIRSEDEYHRIWQYIDENPVKWTEDEYYG